MIMISKYEVLREELMKIRKNVLLILSVVMVLTIFSTTTMADGVNQTNEIQGITTTTFIDVVGMASNNVELAWTSSSDSVQTTVYSENTNAVNGHTVYSKDFSINTGNQLQGQSNVQSSRIITFEGQDGGRMVSDESLLISTSGNPTSAAGQFLCPFGAGGSSVLPAFCNIIEAGSHVDSEYISLATQASSRTVLASGDIPVALNYHINAHGITTANGVVPARGFVSAYMRVHLQGGRDESFNKATDLQYQESTSASGSINSFIKDIGYQSGVTTY